MKNINRLYKESEMSDKVYKEIKYFAKKLPKTKFICTVPKNRLKSWINSGLIKEIEYFIKPDYVLEFDIPKNCKIFVREHIYQSPREIIKKFAVNMYMNVPEPYKTNIWIKYFKSTKKLRRESDLKNFKAPELWVGCKIPVSKIKIRHFIK